MRSAAIMVLVLMTGGLAFAGEPGGGLDVYRPQRQEVFEFAEKPKVTMENGQVVITFASKGYCDATVAVEEPSTGSGPAGRIVRHLASGVLGANAPEPFQKGSLRQKLLWDGQDDQGKKVADPSSLTVRVSLGLKPQFERTLYWEPKTWHHPDLGSGGVAAAPEGVYICDSASGRVQLFDHGGNYARTVHPPPAGSFGGLVGLPTGKFPQLADASPIKSGNYKNALLTCGDVKAIAVRDKRMGLVKGVPSVKSGGYVLNRLATDGSSGGLPLIGPSASLKGAEDEKNVAHSTSAALSPDGKKLYLAGFSARRNFLHCVLAANYEDSVEARVLLGSVGKDASGSDNTRFNVASSVACDAQGRIYVSDYLNDRVQVFDPEGKHLKSIPVTRPAQVCVHQKTGAIYVFSWMIHPALDGGKPVEPKMTCFGPLADPKVAFACTIPGVPATWADRHSALKTVPWRAEVDSWADHPSVWLAHTFLKYDRAGGIELLAVEDGKLVVRPDFAPGAKKSSRPSQTNTRFLYVSPRTGKLYVAEGLGVNDYTDRELVEVDPGTGATRRLGRGLLGKKLSDAAFGPDGLAYLHLYNEIARYDVDKGKEAPWPAVAGGRLTGLHMNNWWTWTGGMSVSPNGWLLACYRPGKPSNDLALFDPDGRRVDCPLPLSTKGLLTEGVGLDRNLDITLVHHAFLGAPQPLPPGWRSTNTLAKHAATKEGGRPVKYDYGAPAWRYGGVGFGSQNVGIHCHCWNTRFYLDYYGRSFAPAPDIYRVAVLDSAGNVILYVGRPGNVDDGMPLVKEGGPPSPRAIGGDEVALFAPNYVAAHTDRRLFIMDIVNQRVSSVKLGYHAEEKVALK